MDIAEKYRERLKNFIEKRFLGFKVILRDSYSQNTKGKVIDFVYKNVESVFWFYDSDGKLFFNMDLETSIQEGLIDKIKEKAYSGTEVDKLSKFLSRPKKNILVNLKSGKICYSLECRIKQNSYNVDPDNYPQKAEELINDLWGYLIKVPIGISTGYLE